MLRAALASTGAHEEASGRAAQTLLCAECPQIVVRTQSHRRLHLGSLSQGFPQGYAHLWLRRTAAALDLPPQASRTPASHRFRHTRHQQLQSHPPRPRPSLHHRLPRKNPTERQQESTTHINENSPSKSERLFLLIHTMSGILKRFGIDWDSLRLCRLSTYRSARTHDSCKLSNVLFIILSHRYHRYHRLFILSDNKLNLLEELLKVHFKDSSTKYNLCS